MEHVYIVQAPGFHPILVEAPDLFAALEAFETLEARQRAGALVGMVDVQRISDLPVIRSGGPVDEVGG